MVSPRRKSKAKVSDSIQSSSTQQTITGWLSKTPKKHSKISHAEDSSKKDQFSKKRRRVSTIDVENVKKRTTKIERPPLNITSKKVENKSTKDSELINETAKKSKKTLKRFNSASSEELPTFRERPRKRPKQTETFKKYGVIVPSVDEVIADQKNLSNYKIQVAEAQTLKEPSFKMPSSPEKVITEEELLDCKHLSLDDISRHFRDNVSFLSDIIKGKKFSSRHRRYYNKRSLCDSLTDKDLTYSTSTIVFSFEQLDCMVSLMQQQFDPEDKKTVYFFKVLIPELCLKIFMDTFRMNKRQANTYLDNRPV